jgi:tRNA A-37 threonylcarbamoyl transferase component Bud32
MVTDNADPFKQNSLDIECLSLLKSSNQSCIFYRDKSMNIVKYHRDINAFNKEVQIYLMYVENEMCTPMNAINNEITYIVSHLVSLRSFLNSLTAFQKANLLGIILNEVFSFVNSFHSLHFVHGNLTIDNIYLHFQSRQSMTFKFYMIDLGHSSIEVSIKKHLDFHSLHLSLIEYLDNDKDNSELRLYIKNIVNTYIQ